jgi:hypothetical protein
MNLSVAWPDPCLLVGLGLVVLGVFVRKKLLEAQSWPKTMGTVVESTIESEWCNANDSYITKPRVSFEYCVEGKKYVSSNLSVFGWDIDNESLALQKAKQHPVGQEVTVYYNPRKPEYGVLAVGDSTRDKLPLRIIFVGLLLLVLGMVFPLIKL